LEPFAALLAARLLEKAALTFAELHFVWQSEISPFPYLINTSYLQQSMTEKITI